ncbi:glutamyl aminopeptidase [Erysipelothrix larvae]|uniref:Glutamyl aminopeptidase n=1 Tax=Erysipelothrix larvae TaxID=1514105 RepID=A0A0X8GZU6_9FIRM|nr:M42 family metallopeptidase [Erysipelothrix larvae]AMC93461.1 glutamyl aminopeptidase [Erysipelothrix larvae]
MLDKQQLEWFETCTQIDGVSGHERSVAHYLKNEYEKMGFDVITDQLGSIVCHKPSSKENAPKVMILGHMDEVGFLVKDITDTGVLKLHPVGGWFSQTLLAHRIRVTTRHGKVYQGAIGSIPPHMLTPEKRNKPMQIEDMIADVGAVSKEEIKAWGIQIGDMVVLEGSFTQLADGDRYLSKAFDNRYGCVMGLDLMRDLKDKDLPFDLYVGASVQEEVGLRGAQTITQLIQPDYAIVLDCSPANDAVDTTSLGKLGAGILVRMIDGNFIANKDLIYELVDTCVKHDIKHQYYVSAGGTDAGIVHKSNGGVPTVTCCIVARNIHTSSSIMDSNDYQSAKKAISLMLLERNWE